MTKDMRKALKRRGWRTPALLFLTADGQPVRIREGYDSMSDTSTWTVSVGGVDVHWAHATYAGGTGREGALAWAEAAYPDHRPPMFTGIDRPRAAQILDRAGQYRRHVKDARDGYNKRSARRAILEARYYRTGEPYSLR